jgi:hypothetical protein
MSPLDRTLVEKAGYDSGFELVLESNGSLVRLGSARHPVRVDITEGGHEGAWRLFFPKGLDLGELRRDLPEALFPAGEIRPWDRQTLAAVLRRAAELGRALPDTPVKRYEERTAVFLAAHPGERGTERERLARERIGQELYREALMEYWKGVCAVTAIDIPEMLRASHAKPWKDCDADADRLNVYNGFLLSANLDALFDTGLMTFTDAGEAVYAASLSEGRIRAAGLPLDARLHWIDRRHLPFLRWHRERVFRVEGGEWQRASLSTVRTSASAPGSVKTKGFLPCCTRN